MAGPQPGSVTKQEVVDPIAANQITVDEGGEGGVETTITAAQLTELSSASTSPGGSNYRELLLTLPYQNRRLVRWTQPAGR